MSQRPLRCLTTAAPVFDGELLCPPRTMLLGVHGVLDMHPWLRAGYASSGLEEDAFSLVAKRSVARQLTGFGSHRPAGSRWDHNDAGGDWTQDGQQHELAWLQAAISPSSARLPIQSALSVLSDVVTRVGRWRLKAVHGVLPVSAAGDGRADLATMWPWFSLADPARPTRLTIRVASNEARKLAGCTPNLCDEARERSYGQLSFTPAQSLSDDPLRRRMTGELFMKGMSGGAQIECLAAEWSVDVAAWILDIFVDVLRGSSLLAEALVTVAVDPADA